MWRCVRWDRTIQTTWCYECLMFSAFFGGCGIRPTGIQWHLESVQRISFRRVESVIYIGKVCGLFKMLVKRVLSVLQVTGTTVAPAGSRCCVRHHKSPVIISVQIWRPSNSTRMTTYTLRSSRTQWYARLNRLESKVSLELYILKICEWSLILQS